MESQKVINEKFIKYLKIAVVVVIVVLFLWFLAAPIGQKLERVRIKYGI